MEFTATLIKNPDLDGAYVEVPFDVPAVFGAKRVKVKASFDGVEYRGSIVSMGGCFIIGVTKAIRKQIGKQPGDQVAVTLEKDSAPRIVEIADDVRTAIDDAGVADAWGKLSYSRQRKHMVWIDEAKKQETRDRRIAKTIEDLRLQQSAGEAAPQ